jgi:hypothetical protein
VLTIRVSVLALEVGSVLALEVGSVLALEIEIAAFELCDWQASVHLQLVVHRSLDRSLMPTRKTKTYRGHWCDLLVVHESVCQPRMMSQMRSQTRSQMMSQMMIRMMIQMTSLIGVDDVWLVSEGGFALLVAVAVAVCAFGWLVPADAVWLVVV